MSIVGRKVGMYSTVRQYNQRILFRKINKFRNKYIGVELKRISCKFVILVLRFPSRRACKPDFVYKSNIADLLIPDYIINFFYNKVICVFIIF